MSFLICTWELKYHLVCVLPVIFFNKQNCHHHYHYHPHCHYHHRRLYPHSPLTTTLLWFLSPPSPLTIFIISSSGVVLIILPFYMPIHACRYVQNPESIPEKTTDSVQRAIITSKDICRKGRQMRWTDSIYQSIMSVVIWQDSSLTDALKIYGPRAADVSFKGRTQIWRPVLVCLNTCIRVNTWSTWYLQWTRK